MAEQENAPDNRRGKIVVDISTQRALAARMMLHCLAFVVLGGLLAAGHQYLAAPFEERGTLLQSILHNFYAYALAFAILFPPLMLDSFRLSNRIVGPICRLRDTVRKISRGEDAPPLRFRTRDYWQDLPQIFNGAIEELRRQGQPDDSEASATTQ